MKFQRKKNLFEYDQSSSNISPNVKDRSLFNTINNRKISYKYNSFYNPNYNENRIRLDLYSDKYKTNSDEVGSSISDITCLLINI